MTFSLTDTEKQTLLTAARGAIEKELFHSSPAIPAPTDNIKRLCGAFVTLRLDGKLRGCIGHIIGDGPLYDTVQNMAVAAAFQDPRFPPLSKGEYPRVSIEISVLSPFKKIDDVDEIQVGKHGIYLSRGAASGLLLPQVAVEQGWDRVTFLTNTCYKAGLNGSCWQDSTTEIKIFSAIIIGENE